VLDDDVLGRPAAAVLDVPPAPAPPVAPEPATPPDPALPPVLTLPAEPPSAAFVIGLPSLSPHPATSSRNAVPTMVVIAAYLAIRVPCRVECGEGLIMAHPTKLDADRR
jgi:hypothetical protein